MMLPFCSISQLVMGTFFVAGTQYSLVLNEKKKQLPGDPVVGSQIFTAPIYYYLEHPWGGVFMSYIS